MYGSGAGTGMVRLTIPVHLEPIPQGRQAGPTAWRRGGSWYGGPEYLRCCQSQQRQRPGRQRRPFWASASC